MHSEDWKSFTASYVQAWRKSFEKLGENERDIIMKDRPLLQFLKPTQIHVITFQNSKVCLWIITHNDNRADSLFSFDVEIAGEPSAFFQKKREDNPKWYYELIGRNSDFIGNWFTFDMNATSAAYMTNGNALLYATGKAILETDPEKRALRDVRILRLEALANLERSNIDKGTEEILFEAQKVQNDSQRTKLMATAKEIEASLNRLKNYEEQDKKMAVIEEEIDGVRKLVGSSAEYQEWRLLVQDVERIKSSFVARELFDSEVKRIDQQIDNMKEIKFWSKRTILDISLAVLATVSTVLAALLGTGIVHF